MHRKTSNLTPELFRERQAQLGWTNAKTADRLHVSESTIEKWRSGAVAIPATAAALFEVVWTGELRAAARG